MMEVASSCARPNGACGQFIRTLETQPSREGHLSFTDGFLPPALTPDALPDSHRPWDEIAAQLPELFFSNRTQQVLERLPVLSASPDQLPRDALPRAGVILGALAHAYWRFGVDRFFFQRITQVSPELPDSILVPWRQLSARLERHDPDEPFQSFYDLFLANFRYRPGVADGAPKVIENLEVLVPSFGNEAERVFYMSFVEMHHHFTPVVDALCRLETAVASDDTATAVSALDAISASFTSATGVWNKISARRGSAVYCDPVMWSKTAAILGVPPEGRLQGATSGACAPVLYLMDALLGRYNYETHYGAFMREKARFMVAPVVHELAERVRRIDLARHVQHLAGSSDALALAQAVDRVIESYTGEHGWLGRHASKVFNYLCVSTITGRNASVSGHERYFSRQTWVEASDELQKSRHERRPAAGGCPVAGHRDAHAPARPVAPPPGPAVTLDDLPRYTRSEVARHHHDDDLWLIIDGLVYDVTPYAAKHPGGMPILQTYAGQDVTDVFRSQVVHTAAYVPVILARLVIGVAQPLPGTPDHHLLHDVVATLVRCKQAANMQYQHPMEGRPALRLFSDEHTHMMLICENLPAAYELLVPGGWPHLLATSAAARAAIAGAQQMSTSADFSGPLSPAIECAIAERCGWLRRCDEELLERLITPALEALSAAERGEPAAWRCAALTEIVTRELAAYFDRVGGVRGEPAPSAVDRVPVTAGCPFGARASAAARLRG